MKLLPFLFVLFSCFLIQAQEFKDNLYETLKSSTLHDFYKSDFTKMEVSSLRKSSKLGFVEETNTTYRKGKINTNRINFSIQYSEYYVIEDRKKSLGRYEFNETNQLVYYERSDFNKRNIREMTYKHNLEYKHDVIEKETVYNVEYLSSGSDFVDTAVTMDVYKYQVSFEDNVVTQKNEELTGIFTEYQIENNVLTKVMNHIDGVVDVTEYVYDGNNRLVRMHHKLTNEKGQSIESETRIYLNEMGMISEVQFYDESNELLEKKLFRYS